jgi:hypothetical protein
VPWDENRHSHHITPAVAHAEEPWHAACRVFSLGRPLLGRELPGILELCRLTDRRKKVLKARVLICHGRSGVV